MQIPDTEPRVTATIQVGPKPVGVAVNLHNRVFVTSSSANLVSVIDTSTNAVEATADVGFRPESVATDPQFGVFVANGGDSTVSVIDRFNVVIATVNLAGFPGPLLNSSRVAVDHLMGRAYVTNRSSDRVSILHLGGELPPFAFDFFNVPGPLGVAVDPMSHRIYVTQPDFDRVSVVDPETRQVIGTIMVGKQPTSITIDGQRRRAYVVNFGGQTVSAIDMTNGGIANTDVGVGPNGITIDALGDVYITNVDGLVKMIDFVSSSVTDRIPVGSQPTGLAFEPHSNRLYVANSGDGTVSAIDLAAH
ncbi:YncE family protein [Streptomyces griseomycini]|uniref:YncE family protein n=1 Tax=Streptomyces griseomycini TaxID=66895 RepID=UPI0016160068|nr:YncE family protein [Streptomyces griseomycini]